MTSFEVYVRVRPASSRQPRLITLPQNPTQIFMTEPYSNSLKRYAFNGVFAQDANNAQVYEATASKLIKSALQGFNGTCFAYGSTGSGKTYTMFGDRLQTSNFQPGLVFLIVRDLFSQLAGAQVKISYLQIYNQHVRDLLNNSKELMILQDPIKGVTVPQISEFSVGDLGEVYQLILEGNRKRMLAPTTANQVSTRSHAVLQLSIEKQVNSGANSVSKLSMIDLAGSQRAAATDNRGLRMVQGANINRSLLALGNCINILSDSKQKGRYIPYRDSKLTRLLKDSLGGNTRTMMIACISPVQSAYENSLHTLKYAQRARMITNQTKKNLKPVEVNIQNYLDIIKGLNNEIQHLKIQLSKQSKEIKKVPEQDQKESDNVIQNLSIKLLDNFEEHWELKQAIKEIESLNEDNSFKLKSILQGPESPTVKLEIRQIQTNIQQNQCKRSELLQNLYNNMKQKKTLQSDIATVRDDKKKDLLQLQITIRTLKMEKMDLYVQNIKIKQEALQAQQQSEAKDKIIKEMQNQINRMKSQLHRKKIIPPLTEIFQIDVDQIQNCSPITQSVQSPIQDSLIAGIKSAKYTPVHSSFSPTSHKLSHLQQARMLKKSYSKVIEPTKKTMEFLQYYKAEEKPPRPLSANRIPKKPGAFSNIYATQSNKSTARPQSAGRKNLTVPSQKRRAGSISRQNPIPKQAVSQRILQKIQADRIIRNIARKNGTRVNR